MRRHVVPVLLTASLLQLPAGMAASADDPPAASRVHSAPRVAAVGGMDVAAAPDLMERGWRWPVAPVRMVRPFVAPAHRYGPGHRGIDLAAATGAEVRAPAGGVVAFAGSVAGRDVLTIDHSDGLVTTVEPVQTDLAAGTPVAAGAVVGSAAEGGHVAPGTVHFGVRWNGEYINPLLLLGGVPRAVLLPCC